MLESKEPTTSRSLICRTQQDEPEAWEIMCEIYAPLVFSWSKRAGLQEDDANDVVQEVFRSLSTSIRNLQLDRPGDKFRAWLWTITRNEIRQWYRKWDGGRGNGGTDALRRFREVPDWISEDRDFEEFDPDDAAEAELISRAAKLIEGDYNERTWQAFWRTTVESQSSSAVGKDLDMTPGAVRQAKFRVLMRLREILR